MQQWRYGAPAIKSTTLGFMGLPLSARTIHAAAVPGVHKPDATLAGVDHQTGLFRAAQAKA